MNSSEYISRPTFNNFLSSIFKKCHFSRIKITAESPYFIHSNWHPTWLWLPMGDPNHNNLPSYSEGDQSIQLRPPLLEDKWNSSSQPVYNPISYSVRIFQSHQLLHTFQTIFFFKAESLVISWEFTLRWHIILEYKTVTNLNVVVLHSFEISTFSLQNAAPEEGMRAQEVLEMERLLPWDWALPCLHDQLQRKAYPSRSVAWTWLYYCQVNMQPFSITPLHLWVHLLTFV